MSFFVNTSMLKGTSCRFSSRLRAVTMTSAEPSEEVSAAASAAAMARRQSKPGESGGDGETDLGAATRAKARVESLERSWRTVFRLYVKASENSPEHLIVNAALNP